MSFRNLPAILCPLLAVSCIWRNGDFTARLAGDYQIVRTSAHQVMIVPVDGWNDQTPIIPTKVVECDHDSRFVIAKRQGLKRRSPSDPRDTYEEPDPGVFDFWILDTSGPQVFGPLTESEFVAKRGALEIPSSLVLKSVNSFRH